MKTINMKPSKFVIFVNSNEFSTKYQAVKYMKQVKSIFGEALIKMIGEHQRTVEQVRSEKVWFELQGVKNPKTGKLITRKIRHKVEAILEKFL